MFTKSFWMMVAGCALVALWGCQEPACMKNGQCQSKQCAGCPAKADCAKTCPGAAKCDPKCPLAGVEFLDKEHAPKGAGWMPLFNGRDVSGWKKQQADRPMTWSAVDGLLVNNPEGHGCNIYTEKKFKSFELYYEYRIPAGSNSGVFLRGQYEIQIRDDYGDPADQPVKDWGNGGFWGKELPSKKVSKPPGEWQSTYVKLVGNTASMVLNGVTVHEGYTFDSPTYDYKELGLVHGEAGPILLQGDHGQVAYRHIMIRPIED